MLLLHICARGRVGKSPNGLGRNIAASNVTSGTVYLVLRADNWRGIPGLSVRPCRSRQTGSGPLPVQTCLLCCRKALQTQCFLSFKVTAKESRDVFVWHVTSQAISHEYLVPERVAEDHAHELPIPRPLDVLAALTAAVGGVVFEGERDPDWFPTWDNRRGRAASTNWKIIFPRNEGNMSV